MINEPKNFQLHLSKFLKGEISLDLMEETYIEHSGRPLFSPNILDL